MKKCILMTIIALLFMNCAGKVTYIKPTQTYETKNSITVNKSKEKVWKQIVPALGKSFFVINNLDKDSGFINISYSGNPEKYVDCGTINSHVSNARGKRTYNFPASSAYKEYETLHNGQNLIFVKRKMNLEGRINIIVQEISSESTMVSVNIKYVLTKDFHMSTPQGQTRRINDSISFNTNGTASFPQSTTCLSTGTLEQEVLNTLGIK